MHAAGLSVRVDGDGSLVLSPAERVTPAIRVLVAERKGDVRALLERGSFGPLRPGIKRIERAMAAEQGPELGDIVIIHRVHEHTEADIAEAIRLRRAREGGMVVAHIGAADCLVCAELPRAHPS